MKTLNNTSSSILFIGACSWLLIASLFVHADNKTKPSANKAILSLHPIINEYGYLIGGSAGGKWITASTVARSMKGQEKYSLYDLNRHLGQGTGTKPVSMDAPCPDTLHIKIAGVSSTLKNWVGVSGNWNVFPRRPRSASVTQPVYLKAVNTLLRQQGIRKPRVKIAQIIRVDLNGDREDEVLISGTNYTDPLAAPGGVSPNARAGDYSFVALRRVIRGKVQTTLLAGEFYKKNRTFNAPNRHKVVSVLDLNGDGRMEIVLSGDYYEGGWTSIYSLVGNRFKEVLAVGCGA